MEEFYLCPFLPRYKLDVIYKEHLYIPKFLSKSIHALKANGVDKFIGELLGGDVTYLERARDRPGFYYSMAYGV